MALLGLTGCFVGLAVALSSLSLSSDDSAFLTGVATAFGLACVLGFSSSELSESEESCAFLGAAALPLT